MRRLQNRKRKATIHNAVHRGSLIKGLLIWLALGGASFFVGFVLLARLIPTARTPDNSRQESAQNAEPSQAARIITPETQPSQANLQPHNSIPPPTISESTHKNIPMPSIDPVEKSKDEDSAVQKPDTIDDNSEDKNRDSSDESDKSSRPEVSISDSDTVKKAAPPARTHRRSRRKRTHEAVQSPSSLDDSTAPIPAAPTLEPGGDTQSAPPKAE